MKRRLVLLLIAAVHLAATETSLVLQQVNGDYQMVINPGIGTATLYRDNRVDLQREDSINFVADILRLQKSIRAERGGKPINALQIGSERNDPTVEQMLAALPNVPTPAEAAAGVPAFQARARAGEMEFWTKEPKYDGLAWPAYSENVLMVVVPSLRTAIFYSVRPPNAIELLTWRNYGADLYVPQVFRSLPLPENLLRLLPPETQEEFRDALAANAKALAEAADKAMALKNSEVWVGAGSNDRFVIVDYANNKVISYDLSAPQKLRLNGVRSIDVDLLVPNTFRATPDNRAVLASFMQTPARKAFIESQGFLPFDLFMLKAIAGGAAVAAGGKVSPVHARVLERNRVMVDFQNARKVVTYDLTGQGNQLELSSVRDYTIDAALAALDAQINDRIYARQGLAEVQRLVAGKQRELALLVLASTLNFDPGLHVAVEKDANAVKALGQDPQWQKLIDEATKDAAAREEARKAAIKAAQQAREEAAKKKAAPKP